MFQILQDVNVDWLGNRRCVYRHFRVADAGGSGIGDLSTGDRSARLSTSASISKAERSSPRGSSNDPTDEAIREALANKGIHDAVVQPVTDRPDTS